MKTITELEEFYDLTNNETEIKDKIFTIAEPIFDEFDDPKIVSNFVGITFSNVTFKDCVFNFAQFIKCTFRSCSFINCKYENSLGFFSSEFYCCNIESIQAKTKDHPMNLNQCEFKSCNFKDINLDEMSIWMAMFHYCRFPYKVYIISNGYETKFIFPDKNTDKKNEQLINSLEQSFDPIPDENEVNTFNEMEFKYEEIKKEG